MFPQIVLFNKEFSTYALMALLGAIISISYGAFQVYKSKLNIQNYCLMLSYGYVGLIIGAKLFYLIPHLGDIWKYRQIIFANTENIALYFLSGFVFYGGLIGLFMGILIYGHEFKLRVSQYLKILIPAIPLFHVFGRIGCYFAGCCYGLETTTPFILSLMNTHTSVRIPIQLIESLLNLLLFLFLIYYSANKNKHENLISIYFIAYSAIRFILEFFRGDIERGIFILSTSQWISIILFFFGIWLYKNVDIFWAKIDSMCKQS